MRPDQQAPMKPSLPGSILIMVACAMGIGVSSQDMLPSEQATIVSYMWLGSIGLSVLLDWRMGLRNLIRVDIFALLALYFLLYFEFLFPQPLLDEQSVPEDISKSIVITCIGMGVMVISRHFIPTNLRPLSFVGKVDMKPQDYIYILLGSFVGANFYMWLAVDFSPFVWFEELKQARFSQPWTRGRYGSFGTLLNELALLGFVIPPIAGVVFARWKSYSKGTLFLVLIILLIQWFVAFSGGTRNVLAVQLAGFLGGFLIVQKQLKIKTVIIGAFSIAGLFTVAADHMLAFRNMGLERYIEGKHYTIEAREFNEGFFGVEEEKEKSYFVDYNLFNISLLVDVFPEVYGFLGWNLPFVAATKPIPRAVWPGKPVDMDVGLEEAVGAEGFTISCTFIGESYVSGGVPGVVLGGLIIGLFCGWWNRLGGYLSSPLALIVYSSGFFSVLITMRSWMFTTTAMLPSIALVTLSFILYNNRKANK